MPVWHRRCCHLSQPSHRSASCLEVTNKNQKQNKKIKAFYTAVPDQDGSKSQIRDWKILLVFTLIEVLKQ